MERPIIVIAEHFNGDIKQVTYELIAFALKLQQIRGSAVKVIILGADVTECANEIAEKNGLEVTAVQVPGLITYNGEIYRNLLAKLMHDFHPSYICVAHTSQGLDFAPALAMMLDAACITGVDDVSMQRGHLCFARPLYGGKIVAHITIETETSVLTIQPGAFKAIEFDKPAPGHVVTKLSTLTPQQSRSIGIKQSEVDTSGISEARVIVSAGQGIGQEENLDLIYQLASLFPKGAVAGSRIVCDMGWLDYKCQIGVTGTIVSPDLYIACGISGSIQHISGMRGSGFIVAINTDPSAAIYKVADVCVVDDLTTFIPTLIGEYKRLKSNCK